MLQIMDIKKTYVTGELVQTALAGVSLNLRDNEFVAILGPSGSGKTTLVKLILHLYEPNSGTINLAGHNVSEYDSDSYRDAFTVVFQDFKIFSLSVAENVLLRPLREGDDELVTEALKKSGAYDKVMTLKNGIHTTLTREFDDEGAVLSVGEAQKVSLARAFTNDSPFVVLDEPSSALDPIAEAEIYSKFNDIAGDKTAIYISHRLSSCKFCGEIAVFHEGAVIQQGSHDALVADKDGKYYELWNAQAQYYTEKTA